MRVRLMGAWAVVLWCLLASHLEAQMRTLTLGDRFISWDEGGPANSPEPIRLTVNGRTSVLDTGNTPDTDIDFARRPGWISPTFFDGSTNISSRVLIPPARITAPNVLNVGVDLLGAQLAGTANGDHTVAFERKPTTFEPIMPAFGIIVQLDFARLVGIERVVFYPRDTVVPNRHYPFSGDYMRGYELWLNDEIPTPTSGRPDRLIARQGENNQPVVDIAIAPQYARLVKLRSLSQVPFEIDEIEVYGHGYLDEAVYYSDLIDLGDRATIGPLSWVEEAVGQPEFSDLRIRMRTGDDQMPLVFYERPIFIGEPPAEVTAEQYWALDPGRRGTIADDLVGWSEWKSVRQGELISARNPRRYVQFEARFRGRLEETRQLNRIEFDYLRPPVADTIWAEVFPRLAQPEEPASFRYAVRLRSNGNVVGFDALEIDTTVPVTDIRNVTLDGEPIDVEQLESPPEMIRLGLPLIFRDGAVLEFTFDLPVFRFGTTFSGRAINRRFPDVPQMLEAGDATDFGPGDAAELSGLFVAIPEAQIGKLVGQIALSTPVVTPNGDGINDVVAVQFNLLQLIDTVPVVFDIYDLSRRRVRSMKLGDRGLGPATFDWDGRDDAGVPLPPGTYIWALRVRADAFEERHTGTVSVAY